MKVRLLRDQTGKTGILPAGTKIEGKDAAKLIKLGVAEPIDAEAMYVADELKRKFAKKFDDAKPADPTPAVAESTPPPAEATIIDEPAEEESAEDVDAADN